MSYLAIQVTHGLSLDSPFPKFAADYEAGSSTGPVPSFQFSAEFRGAAVQFWQSGAKFGRAELLDVSLRYAGFLTGDSELDLAVGTVQLDLDGRRILSSSSLDHQIANVFENVETNKQNRSLNPKDGSEENCGVPIIMDDGMDTTRTLWSDGFASYRGKSRSGHHESNKSVHDQVFTSSIRFYGAPNPETKHDYPFSACMKGYLSRFTYVYVQKDLFRLLNYLSDGIIDVILRRSYEVSSYCFFLDPSHLYWKK